jgi:hypothetical protein
MITRTALSRGSTLEWHLEVARDLAFAALGISPSPLRHRLAGTWEHHYYNRSTLHGLVSRVLAKRAIDHPVEPFSTKHPSVSGACSRHRGFGGKACRLRLRLQFFAWRASVDDLKSPHFTRTLITLKGLSPGFPIFHVPVVTPGPVCRSRGMYITSHRTRHSEPMILG